MSDAESTSFSRESDDKVTSTPLAVFVQPQSEAPEELRSPPGASDNVDMVVHDHEDTSGRDRTENNVSSDNEAGIPLKSKRWQDRIYPFKSKHIPPVPEERTVTAEHTANVFSLLVFHWILPLISTGFQRPLELNDIWTVRPQHKVTVLTPRFQTAYRRRKATAQSRPGSRKIHPLILALLDCFKRDLAISAICCFGSGILQILAPFALRYLILYVQAAYDARHTGESPPSIGRGLGLAIGISLMKLVQALCQNHFYYRSMSIGGRVRATLIAAISEKSMKLSGRAKVGNDMQEGWSNGRINNLMSTDTSRLDSVCVTMHRCWVVPLQVLLALALLCINLTYSALVGFALICGVLPFLGRAAKSLTSIRASINKLTDQRTQLTQEAFSAIRVVKIFAWEAKLESRIDEIRKLETQKMALLLMLRNAMITCSMLTTNLASILTFITYYLSNHELSAAPIFSSLALLNALGVPLEMLPMAVGRVIDAYASVKRISSFLDADETLDQTMWDSDNPNGLTIDHAEFSWEQDVAMPATTGAGLEKSMRTDIHTNEVTADGEEHINVSRPSMSAASEDELDDGNSWRIRDISLSVGRSELIAVIGSVGSGKSSLLSALSGDMRRVKGSVVFGGSRAVCGQSPWIQNATLRQNVTFGKAFDQQRYDDVIRACALQPDIDMLPAGDLTEIGERGITLSGGQKQRLNIARAIYSDTDVVLLDDPLSAVDAQVGQHIMDNAICGLLRSKCRILATHQLHFLRRADRIVWLKNGTIYKTATYSELIENDSGFQILLETTAKSKKADKQDSEATAEDAMPSSKQVAKVPATTLMQQKNERTGTLA